MSRKIGSHVCEYCGAVCTKYVTEKDGKYFCGRKCIMLYDEMETINSNAPSPASQEVSNFANSLNFPPMAIYEKTDKNEFNSLHSMLSPERIITVCMAGSHAYGLSTPSSDVDLKGVVWPTKQMLGAWIDKDALQTSFKYGNIDLDDAAFYTVQKFASMVMKGVPTSLEMFFCGDNEFVIKTDVWDELKAIMLRNIDDYSVYNAYFGYLISQKDLFMNRIGNRKEAFERYGYDPKAASHYVRLCIQGAEYFRTGSIPVFLPDGYREKVLDIKTGKYNLDEVVRICKDWLLEFKNSVVDSGRLNDEGISVDRVFLEDLDKVEKNTEKRHDKYRSRAKHISMNNDIIEFLWKHKGKWYWDNERSD